MIEFRNKMTPLHLGALVLRALGQRLSLSPGQSMTLELNLDDWGVSLDDYDMIVQAAMPPNNISLTFRRKMTGYTPLFADTFHTGK